MYCTAHVPQTGGSIVGPLNTNALSGIRPTHGLISRSYCMALSQTLDKLGPLCRSAMDAALVFDVIRGKDKVCWAGERGAGVGGGCLAWTIDLHWHYYLH